MPNFLALEFHRYDDPTWNDVVLADEPVDSGRARGAEREAGLGSGVKRGIFAEYDGGRGTALAVG